MMALEGGELTPAHDPRRPASGHPHRAGPAGPLRVELQVRRRAAAARRGRLLPAEPAGGAAGQGRAPQERRRAGAPPDPKAPFAGLVFKITHDQHGDLSFVRVYSGVLKANSRPINPGKNKKENCSRLYHIRADDREQIDQALAGDIVGVVGLKESVTGDTLCDQSHPILLERIEFPETVISMAIEPVSSADKNKLAEALASLAREDPTFTYKFNEETGETLISGMGELHLEIIKNKMLRDLKLQVRVGKPRVSYRETIQRAVKGVHGQCIRQTGGSGLYAKVTIDLEPEAQPKGAPVVHFVNKAKPGDVPQEFVRAVEASIREDAKSGGVTGYPLVDLKITLTDGETHEVDSNELAFGFAATDALNKALEKAGAVLLEPIMKVEVVTPEDFLGNVTGDLSSPPCPDRQDLPARQALGRRRPRPAGADVRLLHRRPQSSARAAPATRWSRSNTPRPPRRCSRR